MNFTDVSLTESDQLELDFAAKLIQSLCFAVGLFGLLMNMLTILVFQSFDQLSPSLVALQYLTVSEFYMLTNHWINLPLSLYGLSSLQANNMVYCKLGTYIDFTAAKLAAYSNAFAAATRATSLVAPIWYKTKVSRKQIIHFW